MAELADICPVGIRYEYSATPSHRPGDSTTGTCGPGGDEGGGGRGSELG
jgi:uncharacterized membrane protein